jgi:hypothetical protein
VFIKKVGPKYPHLLPPISSLISLPSSLLIPAVMSAARAPAWSRARPGPAWPRGRAPPRSSSAARQAAGAVLRPGPARPWTGSAASPAARAAPTSSRPCRARTKLHPGLARRRSPAQPPVLALARAPFVALLRRRGGRQRRHGGVWEVVSLSASPLLGRRSSPVGPSLPRSTHPFAPTPGYRRRHRRAPGSLALRHSGE